uniref:EF-hand domain-containing protein n=1 Tax=Mus spicilegus TaxID=10103 RepID=A0A8C6H2W3_MUSSI
MSPLIRSIVDITEVFNQYASQSCDGASLSKKDLKNLLERELGDVLQRPHDPETVDLTLELLDRDCNGRVDFNEFLLFLFKIAQACYYSFVRKGRSCCTARWVAGNSGKRSDSAWKERNSSVVSRSVTTEDSARK